MIGLVLVLRHSIENRFDYLADVSINRDFLYACVAIVDRVITVIRFKCNYSYIFLWVALVWFMVKVGKDSISCSRSL